MAAGTIVVKSGPVTVTLEQSAVLAMLDQLADGAATRFVKRADDHLRVIQDEATRLAPVRRGTLKGGFRREIVIREAYAEVVLSNSAPYALQVFYASRVKGEPDSYVEQAATRAKTPEAAARIRSFLTARRRNMPTAPRADLKDAHYWSTMVVKPHMAARPRLFDDLQADLYALVGTLS